jgi:hypothetical protein
MGYRALAYIGHIEIATLNRARINHEKNKDTPFDMSTVMIPDIKRKKHSCSEEKYRKHVGVRFEVS